MTMIKVIDLFAGPGGLGEGFAAYYPRGDKARFRIALSVEKDATAHKTLELRAFVRQFKHGEVPADYYAFVKGAISRDELYTRHAQEAKNAKAEAWHSELGVTAHSTLTARVRSVLNGAETSVLIGGPPCQAYSLAGRSRNSGNPTYSAEEDGRHTLYREYLRVLAEQWPSVFVMENVKGLLSARYENASMFTRILDDLREPAKALGRTKRSQISSRYRIVALSAPEGEQRDLWATSDESPSRFIVRCEEYGIPQARHRVILLGVREDIELSGVSRLVRQQAASVRATLADLPALRSGVSGCPDSLKAWREVLRSVLRESWLTRLRKTDAVVAAGIDNALASVEATELGRGGEWSDVRSRSLVHAQWYADKKLKGVSHHETRTHMESDLKRYLFSSVFAASHRRSPVLADFPAALLPAHRNTEKALEGGMFEDRFRVQLAEKPATTITSHIAKDGHYYIHYDPAQCRSLTVREAARLQSFPDNYFFCGGRTEQYHQIGNAVPPLLARQIAAIVSAILR